MPKSPDFDIQTLVKDLKEAVNEATPFLYRLKFAPRTKRQKLNSLIICNAILGKANSIVQLIESNCFDGIAPLARTALLHYVDFKNNQIYEDYGDLLDYLTGQHWMKSLRAYQQTPDSPYSRALLDESGSNGSTLSNMIKTQERELKDIKARLHSRYLSGNKVVTSEYKKFELAQLLDVYHAYYRLLSKGAHGNLDVLAGPLITQGKLQWPPTEPEPSIVEIHLVLDIVLEATIALAKKYRKPVPKCRALRKSYYKGLVARSA